MSRPRHLDPDPDVDSEAMLRQHWYDEALRTFLTDMITAAEKGELPSPELIADTRRALRDGPL